MLATCVTSITPTKLPIILLMAGGDDIFETYNALLEMTTSVQIALVCGRHEDLRDQLLAINVPIRHKVKIEGFTRVMRK